MKRVALSVAVFAVLLALVVTPSMAAKAVTLELLAEKPDKVAKAVWFGPKAPGVKKIKAIGLPKKVGLISFYIWDQGTTSFSAMAYTYGGTYQKSFGLNDRGANIFATEFAKQGVPALKKRFADQGMELLIPVEFLDTDEKKQAYIDFTLPKSGWQKFAGAVRNWLDKNPSASGAADGFRMIPSHIWMDRGILNALAPLRETLELDALVVVSHNTASRPHGVALTGVMVQIFGPNPEPMPEKYAKYWTAVIPYLGGTYGKGFKGAHIMTWKSGKDPQPDFDGYGVVLGAIAGRTLDELQAIHDKGK